MAAELNSSQRAWRWRIFALTWMAYAGFYLCRKNFSVMMPLMSAELHFTKVDLAKVVFGYSLFYALGQFASGVFADRFGSRLIVTIGLLIAITSNLLMGFAATLGLLTALACCNGAGQSAGWPALVKNMAAWFRLKERGVVMAWWTTNYVVGGFLATNFATLVVTSTWLGPHLGWRRGFWIPALVLLVLTVIFFLAVRNHPADAGVEPIVQPNDSEPAGLEHASARQRAAVYWRMLGDWEVWTIAIGAFFSKVTRYSFLFWLPFYLTERLKYGPGEAGYTSSVFELAGFGGALLGGYVSDKLMQSRRLPVAAMMMWGLAGACWLHPKLAALGHGWVIFSIALIGVMNYGPDTLMQGSATQDVGARWGVGAASGFVDGVSSLGQLVSPFLVGIVADRYGWDALFYVFVVLALIGGAIMATRWRHAGVMERSRPETAPTPIAR